jgi:hypothetical protein
MELVRMASIFLAVQSSWAYEQCRRHSLSKWHAKAEIFREKEAAPSPKLSAAAAIFALRGGTCDDMMVLMHHLPMQL